MRHFAIAAVVLLAASWACAVNFSDEDQIKEAWKSLQAAVKARDAEKLWGLIDSDTQADADRAASRVLTVYKRSKAKDKTAQEKSLGLSADEMARVTGKMLLKTKRFHARYDEIPDSKLEKITIQADKATLNYLEPDGDKEKLVYVQQGGKWKVTLPLPKFTR